MSLWTQSEDRRAWHGCHTGDQVLRPLSGHTLDMDSDTKPRLADLDMIESAKRSTPLRLYHAAPRGLRPSIRAVGIDPTRFPRERWDASDVGVWCFDTADRARDYATQRALGPLPEPYDVWVIDTGGLTATRPGFDPMLRSSVDVWYLAAAVPAERVQLVELGPDLSLS